MKRRMFASFFLLAFLVVGGFLAAAGLLSFKAYETQLNKDLDTLVTLIRIDKNLGVSNEAIIYKYGAIGHISFIDLEGNIINQMPQTSKDPDSLLGREEVREALQGGGGSSLRYSDEDQRFYFYKAYEIFGEVLMLAIPIVGFGMTSGEFVTYLLLALGITGVLAGGMTWYFYRRNIGPVVVLERFIRRTYRKESIPEVGIQSLPPELKAIAEIFKETTSNLENTAAKEQEKKMYLMSTVNALSVGYIVLDQEGKIRIINKSARDLFGLGEDFHNGETLLTATQNITLNDAVTNEGTLFAIKELLLGERLFELSVLPLPDEKGKVILLEDVTELRRLENMRREFVSNVSHELKTPLTAIRGFVETLKGSAAEDPAVTLKFLDIIDAESMRLERLIEDLLSLSNIEERSNIRTERFSTDDVVSEVLEALKGKSIRNKITLDADLASNLNMNGSRDLFKALIYNLVDNGLKYNHPGGEVALRTEDRGDRILLEVKDNGIGIGAEDRQRVFERFYKADKSRSLDHESTGLGLSIVKHIVEYFGGEIQLESELDKGSTFRIILPNKGEKA